LKLVTDRVTRESSVVIRIPCLVATVAGDDDVAALKADTSVLAGAKVGVTVVAGKPSKFTGEPNTVALSETAGSADVLASTLVVACLRCLAGQFV